MAILRKQKELVPYKTCYTCGDPKLERFFDWKIKRDGTKVLEGRCIECLTDIKKKKKALEKKQEESNTGLRYCKKCDKTKKLILFPEKGKNGARYVDCGECRNKKK